jgi:hypothetical protein
MTASPNIWELTFVGLNLAMTFGLQRASKTMSPQCESA